jgi:hypothetical protein
LPNLLLFNASLWHEGEKSMNTRTRLYGMQYRSMHTAVHHVAIFHDRQTARGMEQHVRKHEMLPTEPIEGCVADIEINFRQPPAAYRDAELVIVNAGAVIPDVFGCA